MEQLAQLKDDSAIALYRAARRADPTYFTAQWEYVRLMQRSFRAAELHREFATTDSTSALRLCLMTMSQVGQEDSIHPAQARRIEARFGATPCTDAVLLVYRLGDSPERDARATRDSPGISEVWGTVASRLAGLGNWRSADETLAAALKAVDDPMENAKLAMVRINVRLAARDTAGALAQWNALATAIARDGRPGPTATYLSARCTNLSYFDPRATDATRAGYCRQFFALVRPRRAWLTEFVLARALGVNMWLESGNLPAAIPMLTRLVNLSDSLGVAGLQLDAYTQRGRAYTKAGRLPEALRDLKHAIARAPGVEMPYYQGEAYHNLAHAYEGAGRLAEAAAAADTFATTADLNPMATARWMSRHDAGEIRWKAGWHAAATRDYEMMARIVDAFGNNGHYFVGEYLERKGDLGRALEYYRVGAALPNRDPRLFGALARVYEALGFSDSAEATARRHEAESDRWPMTERPLLPDLLAARGRVREAVALADAWALRVTSAGNIEGAAIAQLRLAELRLMNRDAKAALVSANTADSLTRLLGLTAHAVTARTLIGRALVAQGQQAAGLAALQQAVRLANAHPSTDALLSTNLALGDALDSSGRGVEALTAYDGAATAVERMTAGLNEDQYRTGYKSLHLAPFDGALRVLLGGPASEPSAAAALAWSARRKAAALTLAGQPSQTNRRLAVSDLRSRLRADEALVDFTVLDSAVAAIVVRRESVTRIPIPASRSLLTQWVTNLRRPLVTTPGGRIDLAHAHFDAAVAESLYRALILPLRPALTGVKSIAIAPDGALWYVPFAALVTGRAHTRASYLIEQYQLRLLPSPQFLGSDATSKLPPGFRVAALSYSVPGGAAELAAIRKSLGAGRVVSRDSAAATERAALNTTTSVLHMAVHGIVDDRDPLASHLRLAPEAASDGLLHLSEVAAHRASPRLVVLTACEAVNGKLYAGEGLVGLARAFLMSGARQVIASEWPVAASAADLTGVLYGQMAAGQSPAASLRSAQLALLKKPETAHPIHWAGFVVFDGGSARSP